MKSNVSITVGDLKKFLAEAKVPDRTVIFLIALDDDGERKFCDIDSIQVSYCFPSREIDALEVTIVNNERKN